MSVYSTNNDFLLCMEVQEVLYRSTLSLENTMSKKHPLTVLFTGMHPTSTISQSKDIQQFNNYYMSHTVYIVKVQ